MARLIDIDKRFHTVGRQTSIWLMDYEAFERRKLTAKTRAKNLAKLNTRLLRILHTFCQLLLENTTKFLKKYDTKEITGFMQVFKSSINDLEKQLKKE